MEGEGGGVLFIWNLANPFFKFINSKVMDKIIPKGTIEQEFLWFLPLCCSAHGTGPPGAICFGHLLKAISGPFERVLPPFSIT